MKKVKIYSFEICPYCIQAKLLLDNLKVPYEEIILNKEQLSELSQKTKMMTVPQIFIEDELIGGFDDLNQLNNIGQFLPKLK